MLKPKISPSMMCVDIFRTEQVLIDLRKENIEYLHIDVMDGCFVPNYCLGTDYCRQIRTKTSIPFDIHLMIENPFEKINIFDIKKDDIVSVHFESGENIKETLLKIKNKGAHPFIAINPDTDISVIDEFTDIIDGVLLMTVYPGFAGQKMIEGSLEKIRNLRTKLDSSGKADIMIEVDGNVNYEKAPLMRKSGADIFVVGTSSIFGKGILTENTAKMRNIIGD